MLCSALVLGVWPEAQASLWEIEAFRNDKEIGVTSKTSLIAVTERMNKLNSVSTVDAKRMYRWLYDYWLNDTSKWSNDGKRSTFGNIQGFCNQDYIVETEAQIKEGSDWTTNFNLMLRKIENLLPEAAANNGDDEIKKTQEEIDQEAAAEAAREIRAENLKTDKQNTATWGNKFKVTEDGYIVKDETTRDPTLSKDGANRIESEQLVQKQTNKEAVVNSLLAQEQSLDVAKQTTIASLKALRIVDEKGKISADESGQLYINPTANEWINYDLVNAQHEIQLATEEQRIRHALELSQVQVIENMGTAISAMEASLFDESPNINALTPFDLTYLSKVMGDAGVTVDDDFIVSLKRAWSMQALDMSESGMSERLGSVEEEGEDKGNISFSKFDPNAFTNADIANIFLSHFKGTATKVDPAPTEESLKKFDLRSCVTISDILAKDIFSNTSNTADKLKYHLNFVARTLEEIKKEKDAHGEAPLPYTQAKATATLVESSWFHSFRQYMLQAFREAFSLIKEQHKEDREDWLASLMPATKKTTDNTSGIITHEGDPETNKTDIQWASDLTPCDATKPVAAD